MKLPFQPAPLPLRSRRRARRLDLGLTAREYRMLSQLSTPQDVQNFIAAIPVNHEIGGETCMSVREVLHKRRAHCIEGAFVAACALWINGEPPLLMNLRAENDDDHALTLFRRRGRWGAISKTNAVFLRYRDPVYRTLRELALSYLHEYANKHGEKSLRAYSRVFDLRTVDPGIWVTSEEDCWELGGALLEIRHYPIMTRTEAQFLSTRDSMERRIGKVVQYPHPKERAALRAKRAVDWGRRLSS
jgi:hypothetical protein